MDLPRIAILSHARFPFPGADTFQVIKSASALYDAGLDVCLIAPRRYGRVFLSKKIRGEELRHYYNITNPFPIVQLLTFPSGKIRLERITHNVVAPLYAFIKKYDIVYTRQPSAAFYGFMLGKKIVFETYRLLASEFPKTFSFLSRKNFFHHPRFLGCITHSNTAKKNLVSSGMPANKVVVIHNGFDQGDVTPVYSKKEARARLGLSPHEPLIVYAGNMQPSKCVETVLDMAAQCQDFQFYLIGGEEKHVNRLKTYAAEKKVNNAFFTGFIDTKGVAVYLYAADVLVIPPTAQALKGGRTVLPLKLYIYLASGRPILAPRQEDMEELLTHSQNAYLVQPDNMDASVQALKKLISNKALSDKIGNEAKLLSKNFTWENRGKRIKEWILQKWENAQYGHGSDRHS